MIIVISIASLKRFLFEEWDLDLFCSSLTYSVEGEETESLHLLIMLCINAIDYYLYFVKENH